MPAKNGRGLDEQGCFTPSWRDSRGENNREALPVRPPDAAGNLPLGGDELLSKKRVLRNQFYAAANEIHGQPENELKKVDHVCRVLHRLRADGICSQDGRLVDGGGGCSSSADRCKQSEPPGDRTQDPRLKRPVLYQLS